MKQHFNDGTNIVKYGGKVQGINICIVYIYIIVRRR